MELITGFTPGEGGEGAQVRRTRVEGRSLSILSAMGVEVSSVASSFFPSILSSLHASLPPFNLLLIIFLLVFLASVLGLALLLEGQKRQYYIAIMRCWLPCLTLYCQSRSRSPEAGRKKKLKVVCQEHDFPPEILFVVVQHMWHTQATRRQQEGIDSSKGHRVNT